MEKVTNNNAVITESYQVEFIYDPAEVYTPGEYSDAMDFVEDYCDVAPSDMADTVEWLHKIPVPEAVKFCAEAWGIFYRLRKTTTIEEYIE